VVTAQTLPERNASHRILGKLAFRHLGIVDHPEDGTVWEWRLGER
jgi:ribosomal-protein-alanine N-acetyltransferase